MIRQLNELRDLKPGCKIVYAYPENGYDVDRERGQEYLILNKEYTVSKFEIDKFYTRIWLKELEELDMPLPFNSVLFGVKE